MEPIVGVARIFREALICRTEDELGQVCLAVAAEVTGSALGFIVEIDGSTGTANLLAASDPETAAWKMEDPSGHGMPLPAGLATHEHARVLAGGGGFFTNNPPVQAGEDGSPAGRLALTAFLAAPLIIAGQTVGVLGLGNRVGGYSPRELTAAEAIAAVIVQVFRSKRWEQALRASEAATREAAAKAAAERARLQAIIDTIPAGFFIVEADGQVSLTNDEARRIWAGEAPLASISDYSRYKGFRPDTGAPLEPEEWPAAQAIMHGRTTSSVVVDIERFDGSRGTLMFSGAPIRDAAGAVTGAVVAIQDVSELKQVEAALRTSERNLAEAQRIGRMGSWEWNVHTGEVRWSRELYTIAGVDPASFVPTVDSFVQIVHPADRALFRGAIDQVASAEEPIHVDFRIVRPDGAIRALSGVFEVAERGHDGRAQLIVGVDHDITQRKCIEDALRESEARFRTMADGLPLFVWVHGPDGRQQLVNRTYAEFFGVDTEQMKGGRWQMLLHPDDAEGYLAEFADCVRERRLFHAEARARRADGAWCWIESWGRPRISGSGEFLGFVGASADISARKQAERELQRSRDELERLARTLEQRVHERTIDLERRSAQVRELHAELSRAEQRQRRQLSMMLHDGLQQLLVAAKIRTALARRVASDEMVPMLAEIQHLLDDCVGAARTLTVELSPPVLHDRGLVAGLHWLAREMEDKQRLAVEVRAAEDAEPEAEDVRLLLFQVTRELLFNVAKHAKVGVAVVTLERTNGSLSLEVADAGAGFEPAMGSTESRLASFGLKSVQQRVEWLGGAMEIDSAPGRGTRVRLVVPLAAVPAATAVVAERPSRPSGGAAGASPVGAYGGDRIRVMLADDHKIVREGLVSLLGGYPDIQVVAQAADGEEAILLAREHRPDVIVMDLSMPRLDGIEATRRITAEMAGVRVIGLSMHDGADVAGAMREAGAIGYVRKGGALDHLIDLIREAVPTA